MKDLSLTLLKHNMTLCLVQLMNNYSRCAGSGLFGVLSDKEQEVVRELEQARRLLDALCDEYYDDEERTQTI